MIKFYNDVRATIYEYLDQIWAQENRVPGPSELHRVKGVSKGYASGVIKDWQTERNIAVEVPEPNGSAPQ